MQNKSTYFKYCIVPHCINTTVRTPNKIFIRLPDDIPRRQKWLRACRRDENDISHNSKALHVCEDHFNLEEDMDNYVKFKLMGGIKKMKASALPHIFKKQLVMKQTITQTPGSKRVKRNSLDEVVSYSTSTSSKGGLGSIQINPSSVESSRDKNDSAQYLPTTLEKKDVSTQIRPEVTSKSIQCELDCDGTVHLLKYNSTEVGSVH